MSRKGYRWTDIISMGAAALIGIAMGVAHIFADLNTPTVTSSTVEFIADNTVRLEVGEVLVVADQKSGKRWAITVSHDSVRAQFSGGDYEQAKLRGVHENVVVGSYGDDFIVTRLDDEAVKVRWPDGWHLAR